MGQTDPYALARDLRTLANLLDIAGQHRHAPQALRTAADALWAGRATVLEIRTGSHKIPGVGPETRSILATLADAGLQAAMQELAIEIPASVSELLSVPGIGPATAHTLYQTHGIDSLAALDAALSSRLLVGLRGFGVERLHRMERDTEVLIQRQRAIPVAVAWPLALQLKEELAGKSVISRVEITGGLRRLEVMVPCIELLAETEHPKGVEDRQVMWRGERIPVRMITCRPAEFGRMWLQTTGDETHWALVEALLRQNGVTEAEAGITEKAMYAAVELPWLPPELREGRGVLQSPAALIAASDIQGDLHVHTTWSDGSQSIAEAAAHAERLGYRYIAITDHSQSLTIAHGLTPEDLMRQRAEIRAVQPRTPVRILHGVECDIRADGTMDLPDETLAELDIVIASVHGAMHQSMAAMTKRVLRAVEHPSVDIIGHPTGRMIGRRAGFELDMDAVFRAAKQHGIALELNANPNRLDLSDEFLRQAAGMDIPIAIDTDAHSQWEFEYMAYGIRMARRGWLQPSHVLNALPFEQLQQHLHRNRRD